MTSAATVFIVDDDPAYLESLALWITSRGLPVRTYKSADEFLREFTPGSPGCVILDVRMPGTGGLDLQEKLAAEALCPAIVVVTGFAEIPTAVRAIRHGAVEYLQKTCSESELWSAIERALVHDAENRSNYAQRQAVQDRLATLSPGERDVLDRIVQGMANKNIATSLSISERTVENRRAKLMEKLEVATMADLIRVAIAAGLEPR